MDWLQVAVQWLPVLLGIVWFGSAITTNLVFVRASHAPADRPPGRPDPSPHTARFLMTRR